MTPTRRSAEAHRLLGLRRVVVYHMTAAFLPAARPPAAVIKAGTMPKVKA